MNLKSIEYIVKIAEEKSMSKAAEKLFITPSALNQHLLHLEDELGAPLFYRDRSGWTPTAAGEVYLEAAREMLRMKRETYHRLQDIAEIRKGTLAIGFPPERGTAMFRAVYPLFHKEYPEIVINVVEASVRRQQTLIAKGELDIGFLTLSDHQKTEDEYIHICSEELVLAVPVGHPAGRLSEKESSPYPELELTHLRYEPFALMYRESTVFDITDQIFRKAGFVPNVLFETARAHTIIDMVASNLCCGIVPSYITQRADEVDFFCLPQHPTWDITASYKKNCYLSDAARRFVKLAGDYWCCLH
ncbi:MAG: LysR family transcriptional regulator [Lachnospiraceae bacterium]